MKTFCPSLTVTREQFGNIVCCVQYSEAAVRDYNRGRHYLTDLARRAGVPVFDSVDDAMACVLARLKAT